MTRPNRTPAMLAFSRDMSRPRLGQSASGVTGGTGSSVRRRLETRSPSSYQFQFKGIDMLSPSERRGLRREAEDIIDNVQESGRTSLTKAEQERFDTITETLDVERHCEEVRNAITNLSGLKVTRDKKVYRSDERLSDRTPGSNNLSLDRMVRGMATGYWDGAEAERRAMGEGTDSAGGFLVPTPLANRIFDLARSESVCIAAGAQTVPMDSETLRYAKVNTDVSSGIGIVAENATISASDYVFGSETLTAYKLASRHEVSLELLEDGQGIESFIERSLAEQFALAVDHQLLSGSGSNAPLGILNNGSVNSITSVGTPSNYSKFAQGVEKVREDNFSGPLSLIMHPRDFGTLDQLADTTGQPMQPPKSFEALRVFQSTQIGTTGGAGSDESKAVVGDFREMLVGMRSDLRIEVSRVSGDAFKDCQVHIRGIMRFGVAVPRPTAFCKLEGITA